MPHLIAEAHQVGMEQFRTGDALVQWVEQGVMMTAERLIELLVKLLSRRGCFENIDSSLTVRGELRLVRDAIPVP
jgi:hypothetical protein